jgi:protein-ribulosamine 3-kinase
MMEGEYNSMREIEKYSPSFVPRPCTWGKFQEPPPNTYFLVEFSDLDTGHVDPGCFCSRLAELHLASKSPNGKFGFHLITCQGPMLRTPRGTKLDLLLH